MSGYYFTFRSLTGAQRAVRALESAGVECTVLRTPRAVSRQGCGYCVRADSEPQRVKELLAQQKIVWQRVYLQLPDGRWEEA